MVWMQFGFWLCGACIAYTYFIYPGIARILALLLRRKRHYDLALAESVSVVIAALNAENRIVQRIKEFLDMFDSGDIDGEVIIVSDGSTDSTASLARSVSDPRVHVVELSHNQGKAVALSAGCMVASNRILIFGDVRQVWAPNAIEHLLGNFVDQTVGAVSGELVLEAAPGVLRGVGLYWRHEKWLRKQESDIWASVGVTGAICAVRRELFAEIPPGTILDDVYWPMRVVLQGYRVVHDGGALAFDRLPERTKDEFARKVRTLSGNYQLLTLLPAMLVPWKNPVWFQFVSHKVARLAVPWLLISLFIENVLIANVNPVYGIALTFQVMFYCGAVFGLLNVSRWHSRTISTLSSFVVLNAAAWLAFWKWLGGNLDECWYNVNYSALPAPGTELVAGDQIHSDPDGIGGYAKCAVVCNDATWVESGLEGDTV